MSATGSRCTLTTTWLTSVILLAYYVTDGNALPACNPTYLPLTFNESTTRFTVLNVSTYCSPVGFYKLNNTNDTNNQFQMSRSNLVFAEPDADARLKSNTSMFANPWTVTIQLVDMTSKRFAFLTVFITLISINDNPARMINLTILKLPESTPVGDIIGGCTLVDGDYPGSGHDIPYVEITAGNEDNTFAVDHETCAVRLIRPLSYANKRTYSLSFRAYNFQNDPNATTQTVSFNVTPVNMYPPKCSPVNIVFSVPENTTVHTKLTTLNCTDYDGTENVDYMSPTPGSISYLNVGQQSGDIVLTNPLQYDNNDPAKNIIQMTVDVVPRGLQTPATTLTITVYVQDVDDHPPEFSSSNFSQTLPDTASIGTAVLQLSATDDDAPNTYNSRITFGFETQCTPDLLVIDSSTGTIYVNKPLYEVRAISCQVYAYSSARKSDRDTASVSITITSNSNKPPAFSQAAFEGNITENAKITSTILTVDASDPDNGSIQYFFPSGQTPLHWPFAVDSVSGAVTVMAAVDYETTDSYSGPVVAVDNGVPPLTSTAYITVHVNPVNEYPPVFSAVRTGNVDKMSKPGTRVMTLSANDADAGDDGRVEFYLQDANVPFVLDPVTGNLSVGIGLDQVTTTFYNLTVTAEDKSKTKVLSSTVAVIINFDKDKRNNDPVCDPLGPLTVTPNKSNVGDAIGYLICTDADLGTSLRYDIIGSTSNQFNVVKYNGTIRLATTPIAGSYILVVEVSDQGAPARTAVVSVQINVVTKLTFTNLPATRSVYENASTTSVLYTVKAEGAFDLITYAITGGNTEGKFNLHQTMGVLRLVTNLDREKTDSYTLQITATTTDGQSVKQSLTFTVLDINDNAPAYSSWFNYIKISERMSVPSTINQYPATDRDILQNAEIVYSIISRDRGNKFKYTSTGGLQLISKLNYDIEPFYELVLCATDKGVPPLSSTMLLDVEVVDENDNNIQIVASGGTVPLSLPEDTAIGAAVFKIQVQNNDTRSELTFTITSGNSDNNFSIDERTGVVYLIFALDRENASVLTIGVRVNSSSGKTDNTMLVINITDVNDNSPVFNPDNYVFLVPHGTSAGSSIGTLSVTDADLGAKQDISLSISLANPNNVFTLSGKKLMSASLLDANVNNQYKLEIVASDHGTPSRNSTAYVTVIIQPEFKVPYFIPRTNSTSIEETRIPSSLIYDADATYLGAAERSSTNPGDLMYVLSSGDRSKFYVEQDSGIVQLVSELNFSVSNSYTLIITASNKRNLSVNDNFTLVVIVTQVNRYEPVFSKDIYFWDVSETAAIGTLVGRLSATDKDQGKFGNVSYSIQRNRNFSVNSSTGVITLVSAVEYSIAKSYAFPATATDDAGSNSRTATSLVFIRVIDMNNHYPRFINIPYIVTVPETWPVGYVLQIVTAEDLDAGVFGAVSYSIISGNLNGKFALDSKTGVLTLSSSLDFESGSQYMLIVQGQDGGSPPLSNTTIVTIFVNDQNDHAPYFGQTRVDITIPSDTSPMTSVYQASASDADTGKNGMVNYIIQDGNDDHLFSIDTVRGIITTATSLVSAGSFHTLTVAAIDQGLPPLTGIITIAITIRPVQQSPGSANFDFSVKENEAPGTLVGTIPRDPSQVNVTGYIIRSGNTNNSFEISTNANQDCAIGTTISLDRDRLAYYQLTISVSSSSMRKDYTVNVKVTDVNDNAPVFDNPVMTVHVVENLPAGNTICSLTATDPDENGVNNQVDLFILPTSPPTSTYFSLEPSGTVKLKKSISYEDISSLTFFVVATDRGTPKQTSTATIYVKVVDVNETIEYNPVQTASFVAQDFPDDAAMGDVVCHLTPADVGVTPQQDDIVTYTTVGVDSVFNVHSSSGDLLVYKPSFVFPEARYFQWVVVTVASTAATTSYALMIRLDTFSKDKNLISVKVNAALADLQSRQTILQASLQSLFTPPQKVQIWDIRSTSSGTGNRRLLASESEALVLVEADNAASNMSNVDMTKTFLTSQEVLKVLQRSSDGSPVQSLAASSPSVSSVQPYSNNANSDELDPAYIALIVIASIAALAIIAGIVALVIYFGYCRRVRHSDKTKLVKKKNKSKETVGNMNESKVRSEPAVVQNNVRDPDTDGMPTKPTAAIFISSSDMPSKTSVTKNKQNSSTLLESVVGTGEETLTSTTSVTMDKKNSSTLLESVEGTGEETLTSKTSVTKDKKNSSTLLESVEGTGEETLTSKTSVTKDKKNSSTLLESLEEKREDDMTDGTSFV